MAENFSIQNSWFERECIWILMLPMIMMVHLFIRVDVFNTIGVNVIESKRYWS